MKVDQNSHSCPHVKLQPGKPGKVFWLSGPPGAGKSTTCQLMAREKDFVFYEGDATSSFVNPFVDLNADNPSMATMSQKPVKVRSGGARVVSRLFSKPLHFAGCTPRRCGDSHSEGEGAGSGLEGRRVGGAGREVHAALGDHLPRGEEAEGETRRRLRGGASRDFTVCGLLSIRDGFIN